MDYASCLALIGRSALVSANGRVFFAVVYGFVQCMHSTLCSGMFVMNFGYEFCDLLAICIVKAE